jgi:hypothetical protein
MADIKLKDLLKEEKSNIIKEDDTAMYAATVGAILNTYTAINMANATGGGGNDISFKDKIKNFYTNYTKIKPLLKKLDNDPEVQQYVKDNIGGDHKGYQNLIKSKLSSEDQQYVKQLKFDDLPSVKDPEKSAQMKADRDVKLKQQSQDYKAKQADKLKKIAGGMDLDTTKIKNSDTGNDISLRSALSYGKKHPVYQAALTKVKQNKSGNKPTGQNIF